MNEQFKIRMPAREGELEAVLRRELAALLILGGWHHGCDQDELAKRAYSILMAPIGQGAFHLRAWRLRCLRHVNLVAHDAWAREGIEFLGRLVCAGPRPCSTIEAIALAIEVWPSPENYLALGQALLSVGRVDEGLAVYTFLMRSMDLFEGIEIDEDLGWHVREGLAAAWESLGKQRVASGCLRICVEDPRSGAAPLVVAFFLALELGREEAAADFAGQLDRRFAPSTRRLEVCVDGLLARVALLREGQWVPPMGTARLFGKLVESDGAAGLICRRLVGVGEGVA